jgi:hypothetical protein
LTRRKKLPEPKLIPPLGPLLVILAPLMVFAWLHVACEAQRERPEVLR